MLENYYLPGEHKARVEEFITHYNARRYNKSLNNLTTEEVWRWRENSILERRNKIKLKTITRTKLLHRKAMAAQHLAKLTRSVSDADLQKDPNSLLICGWKIPTFFEEGQKIPVQMSAKENLIRPQLFEALMCLISIQKQFDCWGWEKLWRQAGRTSKGGLT